MLVVICATNLSAGWGRTLLSPPKVEPPPHLAGESLENPEDESSEKLVKCPISEDLHMRPISTLGSLRFCQLPHCSDPSGNAHARVDAGRAMPMLAWTLASATAGNAHARMEPGGDPCLENAHARVEGAGSDGAQKERPWSEQCPCSGSSESPTCRRVGGEPYFPHRRSNRPHTSQAKV